MCIFGPTIFCYAFRHVFNHTEWSRDLLQIKMEYSLKLNVIDGVPFEPFITKERMDEVKSWKCLADDVYIVTYPKSGTTWTQQIVKLIKSNGVDDGVKVSVTIPWIEREGPEKFKVRVYVRVVALVLHGL